MAAAAFSYFDPSQEAYAYRQFSGLVKGLEKGYKNAASTETYDMLIQLRKGNIDSVVKSGQMGQTTNKTLNFYNKLKSCNGRVHLSTIMLKPAASLKYNFEKTFGDYLHKTFQADDGKNAIESLAKRGRILEKIAILKTFLIGTMTAYGVYQALRLISKARGTHDN